MDMECIWSHMFYLLRCSLAFYDAAIGYFFFHISLMVVVGNRWNNALRIFEIVVHTHSPLSIVNKKCVAAKLRFTSSDPLPLTSLHNNLLHDMKGTSKIYLRPCLKPEAMKILTKKQPPKARLQRLFTMCELFSIFLFVCLSGECGTDGQMDWRNINAKKGVWNGNSKQKNWSITHTFTTYPQWRTK